MKPNKSNQPTASNVLVTQASEAVSGQKVWNSQVLLGEASTAVIEHAGQRYCLRRTKENKLILTK